MIQWNYQLTKQNWLVLWAIPTIMDKSLGTLFPLWGVFQFTQVQPLPSPTNNVGRGQGDGLLTRCIQNVFRVSTLYRVGGGRSARKFRKGCTVFRGNRQMTEKYESILSQGLLSRIVGYRGRKSRDSGSVLAFPSTTRASVHVKGSGGRKMNWKQTTRHGQPENTASFERNKAERRQQCK